MIWLDKNHAVSIDSILTYTRCGNNAQIVFKPYYDGHETFETFWDEDMKINNQILNYSKS